MPDPFLTEIYGQFDPGRLHLIWRDQARPPHTSLDALVDEVWRERTEAARRSGVRLFNGQLARYLSHRMADGILNVEVGPTDYANFLATNLLNHSRAAEFGWDMFSNPVGTSAVPVTTDGRIIFGVRNQRVAFHAGYVHAIGGGLETIDRRDDGTVDAFAAIGRELHEELNLGPADVEEIVCLGLIRDPVIRQPELVFDVRLRLNYEQAADRLEFDAPDQEHTALRTCADEPGAALPFVRANSPITPVAVGALCLHGRRRFGEAWYKQVVGGTYRVKRD